MRMEIRRVEASFEECDAVAFGVEVMMKLVR